MNEQQTLIWLPLLFLNGIGPCYGVQAMQEVQIGGWRAVIEETRRLGAHGARRRRRCPAFNDSPVDAGNT